jgi:flagellar biosynthetic protein FliQ
MNGPEVVDLARQSIYTMLQIAAPMMIVALVVGVAIALLQALTQVQEMTLVFVPKIVAIFLALLLALPFMGQAMASYMNLIAQKIVSG